MGTAYSKFVWTVGLMGVGTAAFADPPKPASPQEPVGFITGGVIGGFAAGPLGAVIGAGLGTWLGQRVHRAGDAAKAEARVAALESDNSKLQDRAAVLESAKSDLAETNAALSVRLDELAHRVETAQSAKESAEHEDAAASAAQVLDGLQGDVLFRTGSAEIAPEMAHEVLVLAQAVAKSPALKVRLDGYADPRGSADMNLELSAARAGAVRDLFLSAGVSEEALELNAYGKSQSVAADSDGYALERRVRLTLEAVEPWPIDAVDSNPRSAGTVPSAETVQESGNK
jgi:outer membrane protein OmpA-like peptidoglycan-associated protein